MDPATDEENHDSTDSTSMPANDVKVEKPSPKNDKSRLRAKPDIPVMFSDSEDSLDGYYSRKRKNDSESEDDWAPKKGKAGSPKKKVKTEKTPKKPRKPREPKSKKEPKPKKEKATPKQRKQRGKKVKEEEKEENSNDVSDEPELPAEKETEEDADADGEVDGDNENDNDTAEESTPADPEYSVSSS